MVEKMAVAPISFGAKDGEAFIEWPGFELLFETRETSAGLTIGTYYNRESDLIGFIEGEISPSTEDMRATIPDVIMQEIPRYTKAQFKRVLTAVANPDKHQAVWEEFGLADEIWPRSIDTIMFLRHRAGIRLHPIEMTMCPNMTLQARILDNGGYHQVVDWPFSKLLDANEQRGLYLYEIDAASLGDEALADVPTYIRAFADDMRSQTGWRRPDPIRLVSVTCPSTGTKYLLRVPPPDDGGDDDVLSMVAWTFGMNKEEYILDDEG